MKNKIIIGLLTIFLLSSCFSNEKEPESTQEENINIIEDKMDKNPIKEEDNNTEDEEVSTGAIDGNEKETLKDMLDEEDNTEEKENSVKNTDTSANKENTGNTDNSEDTTKDVINDESKEEITTDELINDLSDDFDKELDQEILNLLK